MVILHIASIKNSPYSGVCVAVPQHIREQQKNQDVALINIKNIKIDGVEHQFDYKDSFSISSLPLPFNTPDIVIFHETYIVDYLKIYKQLNRNKIPYIIIPHGELSTEAQQKKWIKKKIANILFFGQFINSAKAIQCLSKREFEATKFGRKKIIGSNGIYMPECKKESWGNHFDFLFIGRLEARIKGLDIMLDAVTINADLLRAKNAKLHIYGPDFGGRYDMLLSMIKERNIEDIVILNHEISGKEKEEAILHSDIFIQTSRSEGMPMGILEALSYGIPCIVTEGTTLAEIVSLYDAGWSAKTDADSVAVQMKKAMLEKATWKKKSYNARKLISEHFIWEEVSNRVLEQYSQIIGHLN